MYTPTPITAIGNCLFESMAANRNKFVDCSGHADIRKKVALDISARYAKDKDYREGVQISFCVAMQSLASNACANTTFFSEEGKEVYLGSRCTIRSRYWKRQYSLDDWLLDMMTPVYRSDTDPFMRAVKWGTDIHLEAAARLYDVTIKVIVVDPCDKRKVLSVHEVQPTHEVHEKAREIWRIVFDNVGHYEGFMSDENVKVGDVLDYDYLDLSTAAVNRRRRGVAT